ncbi:MAG: glycogen debranching enzyme N-terminal domain-containing protein, partial [Saprospiraceae bacterium]
MINCINSSFESVSSKEWIVTNGIGGYASSSICGANTRRYHGLLVASFNPPTDRRVIISKVEETITVHDEEFFISSNQYPDVIHPHGYQWLRSFQRDPMPCAVFASENFSISKTVFMIYGSNTTVIEYVNNGDTSFKLSLNPLCVYRDYHHLFQENKQFDFSCRHDDNGKITVSPKIGVPAFYIHAPGGQFNAKPDWYRNFEYSQEEERGLDYREDAFSIGPIQYELAPAEKKYLILSTEDNLSDGSPASWKAYEKLRLRELVNGMEDPFLRDLMISGDQFLVWRLSSRSHTLIAGYHWFTDWGRDTMIAMRGLIIATGKKQIAESIFRTFLKYLSKGMIPNRFPDEGEEPEYNTIDATLWLFVALYEFHRKFDDIEFIRSV